MGELQGREDSPVTQCQNACPQRHVLTVGARRSSSEHTNASPVGCNFAPRLRGEVFVVVHFIYHNSVFEVSGTLVARRRLRGENVSGSSQWNVFCIRRCSFLPRCVTSHRQEKQPVKKLYTHNTKLSGLSEPSSVQFSVSLTEIN